MGQAWAARPNPELPEELPQLIFAQQLSKFCSHWPEQIQKLVADGSSSQLSPLPPERASVQEWIGFGGTWPLGSTRDSQAGEEQGVEQITTSKPLLLPCACTMPGGSSRGAGFVQKSLCQPHLLMVLHRDRVGRDQSQLEGSGFQSRTPFSFRCCCCRIKGCKDQGLWEEID